MKRGSIPLWLLRDLPALIGIALSFWPLKITVISTGRRAMLGKQISPPIYECIMHMLPIAEEHLHYALCRQAWRTLGWNVREVKLEHFPPITSWSDVTKGFAFYRAQLMDLREAATQFTEGLRDIYRIRIRINANAVAALHGSTDAHSAAHHESVGRAALDIAGARVALSGKQRPKGAPVEPRGRALLRPRPAPNPFKPDSSPRIPQRAPTRLRPRPHAHTPPPRTPSRGVNRNPGRSNLPGLLQL